MPYIVSYMKKHDVGVLKALRKFNKLSDAIKEAEIKAIQSQKKYYVIELVTAERIIKTVSPGLRRKK